MKNLFFLALLIPSVLCAQNLPQQKQPEVEFKVQKDYDQDGNLIRYDSTRVEKGKGQNSYFKNQFKTDSLGPFYFKIPDSTFQNTFEDLLGRLQHLDTLPFPFQDRQMDVDSLLNQYLFNNPLYFNSPPLLDFDKMDELFEKHLKEIEELFENYRKEPVPTNPSQKKIL